MRITNLFVAAALAASGATPLSAQAVVYDNGGPNGVSARAMSVALQADDFLFVVPSSFNQVRFWTLENPALGYAGEGIQWWIFADNGAKPGSILYSGTATPTRVPQGTGVMDIPRWQNDLFIPSLSLSTGTTYWLGLHDGTDYDFRSVFWETTNPNGTNDGQHSQGGTMDNWAPNSTELAFELINTELSAVPEPTSIALFATGLIGVFCAARRRSLRR